MASSTVIATGEQQGTADNGSNRWHNSNHADEYYDGDDVLMTPSHHVDKNSVISE